MFVASSPPRLGPQQPLIAAAGKSVAVELIEHWVRRRHDAIAVCIKKHACIFESMKKKQTCIFYGRRYPVVENSRGRHDRKKPSKTEISGARPPVDGGNGAVGKPAARRRRGGIS